MAQDDPRYANGRVPAHNVRLGFTEQEASLTPANLLQKESPPEDRPKCFLWGTRDSLQRGGKSLYAAAEKAKRKPKLAMEGLAFQAKAFGVQWNGLGPAVPCDQGRPGRNGQGREQSIPREARDR